MIKKAILVILCICVLCSGCSKKTSFTVQSWPTGRQPAESAVLDENTAEFRFDWDKTNIAYLRITTENTAAAITDTTFETEKTLNMNETPVKIGYTMSGPMQATWHKDGYAFCLYMKHGESEMAEESFVRRLADYVHDVSVEPVLTA